MRLTDYYAYLDTLTVSEELVRDPDDFFKLMALATGNQAFSSCCQFEQRPSQPGGGPSTSSPAAGNPQGASTTAIEQPAWFKPKSFHTFATWIIVALEENLWAQ